MTAKLAEAYDSAAEALAALAIAIRAEGAQNGAGEPVGAPSFEELPFDGEPFEDTPQGRSKGGGCPTHGRPWAIREAGTSKKTGEPYRAFWHCIEQNDDGSFCREKPSPAWQKAHPIR